MTAKHSRVVQQHPVHEDPPPTRKHIQGPFLVARVHGLAGIMVRHTSWLILYQPPLLPGPVRDLDVFYQEGQWIEAAELQEPCPVKSGKSPDRGKGQEGQIRFDPRKEIVILIAAPHAAAKPRHLPAVAKYIPLLIKDLSRDGEYH